MTINTAANFAIRTTEPQEGTVFATLADANVYEFKKVGLPVYVEDEDAHYSWNGTEYKKLAGGEADAAFKREEFVYTGSGVAEFALSEEPTFVFHVWGMDFDDRVLSVSDYTISGKNLIINDTLNANDKIGIIYSYTDKIPEGVLFGNPISINGNIAQVNVVDGDGQPTGEIKEVTLLNYAEQWTLDEVDTGVLWLNGDNIYRKVFRLEENQFSFDVPPNTQQWYDLGYAHEIKQIISANIIYTSPPGDFDNPSQTGVFGLEVLVSTNNPTELRLTNFRTMQIDTRFISIVLEYTKW
jgi:hypothetical protein